LSPTQRVALASAERSDVTFYGFTAADHTVRIVQPDDVGVTLTEIDVQQLKDMHISASGVLTVQAAGNVNIGSENTITLNQVETPGDLRLKDKGSLLNGRSDSVA